ncbi:MAG: OmpA family protein [Prevotella sp.]|nr:OmpA family protein [Prevotella sp.]
MKKIVALFTFACLSVAAMAQGTIGDEKHSVSTNSFWANWFVQANAVGTSFWGSQENQGIKPGKLFKDYRTNLGFSLAIGKWFTPGIGLRTKFNGAWGRTVISEDKSLNSSKYWTLQEQVLFNLSNMLMGYNEQRVWNFIPYIGAGIGRNMTYTTYGMGLSAGLLNTFRISPKVAINLDINWGGYEPGFDGCNVKLNDQSTWKNKDRMVNVEVGLTYRLGKSTWKATAAQDAYNALTESEIDALNGQLADMQAENDRLQDLLNKQSATQAQPQRIVEKELVSAPVSVFFNLNQAIIASKRELQNVADLVSVAKQQGSNLVVTGYADSQTGSAEHNQQLSQQRADALTAEIVKMGFPREQIETVAAGGVDTLNPQPYNRRATVVIK